MKRHKFNPEKELSLELTFTNSDKTEIEKETILKNIAAFSVGKKRPMKLI